MLGNAQIERQIQFQHRGAGIGTKESARLLSEGEQEFDRLQSMARARLESRRYATTDEKAMAAFAKSWQRQ